MIRRINEEVAFKADVNDDSDDDDDGDNNDDNDVDVDVDVDNQRPDGDQFLKI